MTSDLLRRIDEHKTKLHKGFTSKYNVNQLVYYEEFGDIDVAIQLEKRLKEWPRKWKLNLIEQENPYWHDLYNEIAV